MKVLKPEYFYQFQCIASACPDSCCKEWAVDVDEDAAAFYRSLKGPLGDRLREVLENTENGTVMTIEDGRCPMWREDGLCRIQADLGHDSLCRVCQEFPRLQHDYGNFVEYGLELSCPEAARLILTQSHEILVEEVPGGDMPEYDEDAMRILLDSRKTVMAFLDSTLLPVNQALAVLLLYAHEVQGWIDGGEPAVLNAAEHLELARSYAVQGDWGQFLDFFRNLEILTPLWHNRLTNPEGNCQWHNGHVPLAKYFIERYWLQAVADYDLIGRVKFLISTSLLICRLGGNFTETAQLYSKEIENNPDNLEAIWDGAYTSPALTDIQLLSLLLSR